MVTMVPGQPGLHQSKTQSWPSFFPPAQRAPSVCLLDPVEILCSGKVLVRGCARASTMCFRLAIYKVASWVSHLRLEQFTGEITSFTFGGVLSASDGISLLKLALSSCVILTSSLPLPSQRQSMWMAHFRYLILLVLP